jgi:predicted thioesterase
MGTFDASDATRWRGRKTLEKQMSEDEQAVGSEVHARDGRIGDQVGRSTRLGEVTT